MDQSSRRTRVGEAQQLAFAPKFIRLAAARALVRANQAGHDQRERNAGERPDDDDLGDGEDHAASMEVER